MPPESQTLESLAQEVALLGDLRVPKRSSRLGTHTKLAKSTTGSRSLVTARTYETSNQENTTSIVENASSFPHGAQRYETHAVDDDIDAKAWQFSTEVKTLEVRWETSLQSDMVPVTGSVTETQAALYDTDSNEQRKDLAFENAVSRDTDVYIAVMGYDESDKLQFIKDCVGEDQPFIPILNTGTNEVKFFLLGTTTTNILFCR